MTLPAGWSAVQVTGRYLDTAGAPCAGTVTFTATARLVDQGQNLIVLPAAVVAQLDDTGAFTVELAATDDPDLAPAFAWRVDELVNGRRGAYLIELAAGTPTVDLADVVPVTPAQQLSPYIRAAGGSMTGPLILSDGSPAASEEYVAEHAGGGSGGSPSSTVVAETTPGQAANAGNSATYSRGDHTHGTPALPTAGQVGADPAGTAAAAVAALAGTLGTAATRNVGNGGGTVAAGDDERLSDARTPSAHAASHAPAGTDPLTGLTHASMAAANVDGVAGTASLRTLGTGAQQAAPGDHTHTAASRDTVTWSRDGAAAVHTGAMRWYNRSGGTRTIHGVWAAAGTAPAGAAVLVDVHKNGTTLFTTQAGRPAIADGGNGGALAVPDVTTIADGEWLTVDIDQVGSTVAGADITVGVVMS